jgi:hypothetical protein
LVAWARRSRDQLIASNPDRDLKWRRCCGANRVDSENRDPGAPGDARPCY